MLAAVQKNKIILGADMQQNLVLRAGSEAVFQEKRMAVNINVSDICNFSCSYCINSEAMSKNKRILDKELLANFLEDLGEKNYAQYSFAVAGGEPLLYPHIAFLVESVDKLLPGENKKIYFATNASLLPQRGERLYEVSGKSKMIFSISVHLEQIHLDSYVKKLAEFGHHEDLRCKILLAPGKLDEAKTVWNAFAESHIETFVAVVNHPGGKPFAYSDAEMEFLEQHRGARPNATQIVFEDNHVETFDRVARGLHPEKFSYQGMFCSAGVNALRLAPDGTLARCFGFIRRHQQYQLGEKRLRDIPELMQPCRCPVPLCRCATFQNVPKWRNPEDAPIFLRNVPAAD